MTYPEPYSEPYGWLVSDSLSSWLVRTQPEFLGGTTPLEQWQFEALRDKDGLEVFE